MTVIAYRDGVMAGDGRVCNVKTGAILTDRDVKVFKFSDCLLGVAGTAEACQVLIDATQNGHTPRKLKCEGLRVDQEESIFIFEGDNWFPVYQDYASIGTGEPQAVMAMDMGADAVEAVRATCRRNAFCGGRIRKVSF